VTAVNKDQYQQGLLAALVMGVALFLQMLFHPYEEEAMNNVEVMGLSVGFLSLYLGLWTFHSGDVASTLVTVLIFGLNITWAVYIFVALYRQYKVAKLIVSVWNYFACSKCKKTGYEESGGVEVIPDAIDDDSSGKGPREGRGDGGSSWWRGWWMGGGKIEGKEKGRDVELASVGNKEVVNPLLTLLEAK
jgi:hypothetical protein